ncbi:MAG: hypothetical protein INF91_10675 [Alphaproteobacteria bacterium]|nr:hypothetical protein [Alphaproteobacteria bacterium]
MKAPSFTSLVGYTALLGGIAGVMAIIFGRVPREDLAAVSPLVVLLINQGSHVIRHKFRNGEPPEGDKK